MNVKRLFAWSAAVAAAGMLLNAMPGRADVYDEIVSYDWTKSRKPLSTIETEIRAAKTPAAQKAIEAKLIRALSNPQATYACKQFVCRALRRVGSETCVPALARLLDDEKLSHMARFALQHMPEPAAGEALRRALAMVSGELKIGVISSLGARRDGKAVAVLAKLIASADVKLARAAIVALGRIGSAEAAEALAGAKPAPALRSVWADAYLQCADGMLAAGEAAKAGAIYAKLAGPGNAKWIRVAALRGLARARPDRAAVMLLALLRSDEADLRAAARRYIIRTPGQAVTKAFAAKLSALPAPQQVVLLDLLVARGDRAAAAAVTRLAVGAKADVRVEAVRALGTLGDAASVPVLARAASAEGALGQAAIDSLNRLKGEGVGEAMAKLLDSSDPALRAGILGVLVNRADKSVAPALLKAARDKDERIRRTAIEGLAVVGGKNELAGIVELLVSAKDEAQRQGLAKALSSTASRVGNAGAAASPIVSALDAAGAQAKVLMLEVLGRLGGEKALAGVRAQLDARSEAVATAAVRALAQWPAPAPADDLLRIIKTTKNRTQRVLAFRGYVRMANLSARRSADEATRMYEQALALAQGAAEKKSVLSGLADARSPAALKMVQKMLADKPLRAEAELAYLQVAQNIRQSAPDEARAALKKLIATTTNAALADRARQVLSDMDRYRGFVTTWLVSGPYTKGDTFSTAYPPEKKGAASVDWRALDKGVTQQVVNLDQSLGGNNRAAYLKAYVYSPADQKVRLEIGSDDGVKVWIGGKLVHSNNATRPLKLGQDKADARLAKGWNELLVKVTQGGGEWAFAMRIVGTDGSALEGMRISTEGR